MLRAAVPLFVAAGAAAQNVALPPHNPAAAAHNPLKGMLTSPDWSAPPYLDSLPSGLEFFYVGIDDVMESVPPCERAQLITELPVAHVIEERRQRLQHFRAHGRVQLGQVPGFEAPAEMF